MVSDSGACAIVDEAVTHSKLGSLALIKGGKPNKDFAFERGPKFPNCNVIWRRR